MKGPSLSFTDSSERVGTGRGEVPRQAPVAPQTLDTTAAAATAAVCEAQRSCGQQDPGKVNKSQGRVRCAGRGAAAGRHPKRKQKLQLSAIGTLVQSSKGGARGEQNLQGGKGLQRHAWCIEYVCAHVHPCLPTVAGQYVGRVDLRASKPRLSTRRHRPRTEGREKGRECAGEGDGDRGWQVRAPRG